MKVLSIIPFDEAYQARLESIARDRCELVCMDPETDRARYLRELESCQVLLGDPRAEDLGACRNLKWMQTTWAGVDHFLRTGYLKGVTLCNLSGGYGPLIAEYEMAAILTLANRFPDYRESQRYAAWHPAFEAKALEGAEVLILGAGDIGTELAKRLRPFGCRLVGVRRVVREKPDCFDEMITLAELDEYLPKADVVACSIPNTRETYHLLDKTRLEIMKRDAILVNVGRGGLIVTEDLLELLDEGHFWGVCLDVTELEPLPPEHPLWHYPRVLITPHVSGNGFGPGSPTEHRLWGGVLDNFERYLDGKPCRNVVDHETCYRSL